MKRQLKFWRIQLGIWAALCLVTLLVVHGSDDLLGNILSGAFGLLMIIAGAKYYRLHNQEDHHD